MTDTADRTSSPSVRYVIRWRRALELAALTASAAALARLFF
jgi:hypothetical protein